MALNARRHSGKRSRLRPALAIAVAALFVPLAASTAQAQPGGSGPPDLQKHLQPIDPQNWERPQDMTWDDYRPVPGVDWTDPSLEPAEGTFDIALVLGDFEDQDFLVTQEPGSHPFGNPQPSAPDDLQRGEVDDFYEDFLNTPGELNNGHTLNEYWMEDSAGRYGVDLTAHGPYRLPGKLHEYGLDEWGAGESCPEGDDCTKSIREDLGQLWRDDVGEDIADQYDLVFFTTAGHDESSTWQEFGEMRFQSRDDVPDEFGPPDDSLPNWASTRYIDWTSWLAAANHWPNASGDSSTQAESSGAGTYAHELSHLLGIGDNYNNPYGEPLSRSYTGVWSMLSRGSFNGPGGPHQRWRVPATQGGSMGSHHMLFDKMRLDMVEDDQVLDLARDGLADSGLVVAEVTAREIPLGEEFGRDGLRGVTVGMDEDHRPECDVADDYQCDQGDYNNYTVEVVDRVGFDSFTPGSGVLLSRAGNDERGPDIWSVDANPQDIDLVDYEEPGTGEPAMVSLGDYRQLSDALFKAGTDSGSEYEYVDEANGLHVYILDLRRDEEGVLRYTVALRSQDGSGPHERGAALGDGETSGVRPGWIAQCSFPLTNTGTTGDVSGTHPDAVQNRVDADVYRLSAEADGAWNVHLPREVVAAETGDTVEVPAKVVRSPGASPQTTVTLTAASESDDAVEASAQCDAHVRDTTN